MYPFCRELDVYITMIGLNTNTPIFDLRESQLRGALLHLLVRIKGIRGRAIDTSPTWLIRRLFVQEHIRITFLIMYVRDQIDSKRSESIQELVNLFQCREVLLKISGDRNPSVKRRGIQRRYRITIPWRNCSSNRRREFSLLLSSKRKFGDVVDNSVKS